MSTGHGSSLQVTTLNAHGSVINVVRGNQTNQTTVIYPGQCNYHVISPYDSLAISLVTTDSLRIHY